MIGPEQDQAVPPLSRLNTDESKEPSRRRLDRCRKIFEFLNLNTIYGE